ncbi:MAG: HAD hydrolase family protein [Deltaproteobacteria bacterium]|nr:HAD hydrolase family protein [Deltaproteobacteria bacterium]
MKLNLTQGGRFFHLLGDNDKGKAVRIVIEIYRRSFPELKTIASGDSYNDFPMLQMVDLPILVQKPGGVYDEKMIGIPNLIRASGIGPGGWNSSLIEILKKS